MNERLLSIPEAAERLGLKLRTVRRWVFLRKITYVKVGGAVRIPESEIVRIIQQGTVSRMDVSGWLPGEAQVTSAAPAAFACARREP